MLKNRPIKKAKRRNIGGEVRLQSPATSTGPVLPVGKFKNVFLHVLSQAEGGGTFKGFKGFSLSKSMASGGSAPAAFTGFGNGGGLKGLSSLTNGNGTAPSFGAFSSPPAATSTAAPGEKRLLIGSVMAEAVCGECCLL